MPRVRTLVPLYHSLCTGVTQLIAHRWRPMSPLHPADLNDNTLTTKGATKEHLIYIIVCACTCALSTLSMKSACLASWIKTLYTYTIHKNLNAPPKVQTHVH
jgi:hypothetical protein